MTDTPEEVTEEVAAEEAVEPQADKPNLLHNIINNPVWLALLFLTVIVLALVILA